MGSGKKIGEERETDLQLQRISTNFGVGTKATYILPGASKVNDTEFVLRTGCIVVTAWGMRAWNDAR